MRKIKKVLPWLVAAAVVITGLVLVFMPEREIAKTELRGVDITASNVAAAINLQRLNQAPLVLSPYVSSNKLNRAAQAKLDHMIRNKYFGHVGPDGTSSGVFLQDQGYSTGAATMLLSQDKDDVNAIVNEWLADKNAIAGIFSTEYQHIGVAVSGNKVVVFLVAGDQ